MIRAYDWSETLGLPEYWPQPLKTLVAVMLGSNQPMFIAWGPQRILLYNDCYAEILASKHPMALGQDFLEAWAEIRADLMPIVEQAYAGEPVHMDDIELLMERRGFEEETHFAFSYTPVRDEAGDVAGFFCPCAEITEQVLADRRMLEERERQRRMLQQMPGFAALLSSPEHRYDYVNDAYREIAGEREFEGHTVREVFPELAGQGFYELLDEVYSTGEPFAARSMPISLNRADGERFIDFLYEPIRDEGQRVAGIFVGGYDVTERVRAERAVRESEARFRLMADAVPQIVWIIDAKGKVEFFNKQWSDYVGSADVPERGGDVAARFIHPDDEEITTSSFEQARRGGTTYQVEHRIRSAAGKYRWFLARGEPFRDPETNKIERWFGASVDIHERREAEAALRESEARLRAVIDAAPIGLVFADPTGRITGANAGIEAIIGRPITRSQSASDYGDDYVAYHGDGRQVAAHEYPLAKVVRGEEERAELEVQVRRPDGSLSWVRYIATPIRNRRGELTGAVVASLDIDRERRSAENLAREVERALAEREEALAQVHQMQKMETIGQLTGGVAHDFNNLLTPIIGSLDMLVRRGVGSERERRLVDGALQSAERAKTLVQRLLAFARRQPLQPTAVDAARLIHGMVGLIESTLGPTIEVRVDVASSLPPARGDANQLEMALLNLAVNARDAMPEGGELTITARLDTVASDHPSGLAQGEYVRLCIGDTGTGMDKTTLERAIEPFFSTKGVGQGTGLGLSMVHGLIAQLGGGLTIQSEPGEGTTIQLWLPISTDAVDGVDRALEPAVVPQGLGTALLVDDEELVRMSTADMLIELGYEVVEAASAEDALRLIGDGLRPSLLVTDHLMPGMSGAQLARKLKADQPKLTVLIVSGYAEAEGLDPDIARLTKPFRNAELAASLSALSIASAPHEV